MDYIKYSKTISVVFSAFACVLWYIILSNNVRNDDFLGLKIIFLFFLTAPFVWFVSAKIMDYVIKQQGVVSEQKNIVIQEAESKTNKKEIGDWFTFILILPIIIAIFGFIAIYGPDIYDLLRF